MALGSTQPLKEMSTRSRCVRLTTLPPSCAFVMKSGNLNFLETSGPLQACNGTAIPFAVVWQICGLAIDSKMKPSLLLVCKIVVLSCD